MRPQTTPPANVDKARLPTITTADRHSVPCRSQSNIIAANVNAPATRNTGSTLFPAYAPATTVIATERSQYEAYEVAQPRRTPSLTEMRRAVYGALIKN